MCRFKSLLLGTIPYMAILRFYLFSEPPNFSSIFYHYRLNEKEDKSNKLKRESCFFIFEVCILFEQHFYTQHQAEIIHTSLIKSSAYPPFSKLMKALYRPANILLGPELNYLTTFTLSLVEIMNRKFCLSNE